MDKMDKENLVYALIEYYFSGLVLSRIGSLIVSPILQKTKIIKKIEYRRFVEQEKNDDKWGFITINIGLMVFLGLCSINNNYYYLGDWWQIAIVVVMGLYTVLMLYRFIKELIKSLIKGLPRQSNS